MSFDILFVIKGRFLVSSSKLRQYQQVPLDHLLYDVHQCLKRFNTLEQPRSSRNWLLIRRVACDARALPRVILMCISFKEDFYREMAFDGDGRRICGELSVGRLRCQWESLRGTGRKRYVSGERHGAHQWPVTDNKLIIGESQLFDFPVNRFISIPWGGPIISRCDGL